MESRENAGEGGKATDSMDWAQRDVELQLMLYYVGQRVMVVIEAIGMYRHSAWFIGNHHFSVRGHDFDASWKQNGGVSFTRRRKKEKNFAAHCRVEKSDMVWRGVASCGMVR